MIVFRFIFIVNPAHQRKELIYNNIPYILNQISTTETNNRKNKHDNMISAD